MAFLIISKKYLNILMGQLFFNTLLAPAAEAAFPKILDLYLNDNGLSVATVEFPLLFVGDSSFSNCHKLPDASE